MAYDVIPEACEEVTLRLEFSVSPKAPAFHFAVSDRAIYIPRTKLIAKSDPFYFERVLVGQVRQVNVQRLRPYGLWVLAIIMVLVGVASTYAMLEPIWSEAPGSHGVSGWPFAV